MNKPTASDIIDALGGTCAVAKLVNRKPPSISKWRHKGISESGMLRLQKAAPKKMRAILKGTDK